MLEVLLLALAVPGGLRWVSLLVVFFVLWLLAVLAFVARAMPFGVSDFALAAGLCLRGAGYALRCFCVFAGIRDALACFTRRPCAGRHLLFFAAAKKSRQKKAAHTASPCSCLRAPKGSYASYGNHIIPARCQRSCWAPHPLHAPTSRHALPGSSRPPRWQTVCRP